MSTRYFIHSFQYYKPKNEKIKELFRIVDELNRTLVTGKTPVVSLMKYIKIKCVELDRKYTRTRALTVEHHASGRVTIYCGDPSRSQIESGHVAVSFDVTPVKKIAMFDAGEAIFKEEGGEEV